MSASDFRKGNIAINDGLDIFKKGYIILEARNIYEMAVSESGQTVDEVHENYQPLKLSLSFISKFKQFNLWSAFDGGYFPIKKMNGKKLMIRELKGTWFVFICTITKGLYSTVLELKTINYVHELQNLYKELSQSELSL